MLIIPTVQRVFAVGEPPEGKECFFRGLKNVVVLPAVGTYLRAPQTFQTTDWPGR